MGDTELQRRDKNASTADFMREKTIGYITAALGLVAGLAWNDAVGSLIDRFFPTSRDTVLVKFFYAGLVTIIVVLISMYLQRLFRPRSGKNI